MLVDDGSSFVHYNVLLLWKHHDFYARESRKFEKFGPRVGMAGAMAPHDTRHTMYNVTIDDVPGTTTTTLMGAIDSFTHIYIYIQESTVDRSL